MGKVREFENICFFCLTHTNCTFMHLCYLYLLLIFQRYIISQRSSYIHGISFCTKRIFYSKPERERKRKENVMHSMSYGSWWTKRTYVMDNVNAWELNHMMMSHNLRLASKSTWFLMKQNPIVRLLIRRNTTNIIPHESVQFCFTS